MDNLQTLITAWDETKTAEEWAQDPRATADAKIILKRYEAGQLAETAIGFQKGMDKMRITRAVVQMPFASKERTNARLITAWNEEKTLMEWAQDPRCVVTASCISSRLAEGLTPEQAIGWKHLVVQPKGRTHSKIPPLEAFGEIKTLLEWAQDPRCEVDERTMQARMRQGWSGEDIVSRPARPTEQPGRHYATGFGERKSVADWARDPRCKVSYATLRQRLARGMTLKKAMTKARSENSGLTSVGLVHEAFGERKTLSQWAKDERCVVNANALAARLRYGWDMERALTQEAWDRTGGKPNVDRRNELHEAYGEHKTLKEWSRDARCKTTYVNLAARVLRGYEMKDALRKNLPKGHRSRLMSKQLEAFGEVKSLQEWLADPRCTAERDLVIKRAKAIWRGEASLTWDRHANSAKGFGGFRRVTAFGETKTVNEWAEDTRCQPSAWALARRLEEGLDPELAITTPVRGYAFSKGRVLPSATMHKAFGDNKSLYAWAEDKRCQVSIQVLRQRIAQGWTMERALSTPRITDGNWHLCSTSQNAPRYEAFGESKTLKQWAKDERCVVTEPTILDRLEMGLTMEEALTAPKYGSTIKRHGTMCRMVTAWGETKSILEWSQDERCRVQHATLAERLAKGADPETAISTPSGEMPRPQRDTDRSQLLTAWGVTKSLRQWLLDPLCKAAAPTILARLHRGYTPEEAIGMIPVAVGGKKNVKVTKHVAFGEEKTVTEWAQDPRSVVSTATIRTRLSMGWPVEDALTTPSQVGTRVMVYKQQDVLARGEAIFAEPETAPIAPTRKLTAWGESKTALQWAKDARCSVSKETIAARIAEGLTDAEAVGLPLRQRKLTNALGGTQTGYEGWGKFKTLETWVLDERALVAKNTFKARLRAGQSLEVALSTPPKDAKERADMETYRHYRSRVTAFGETKPLAHWALDPRCQVIPITITKRIRRGWKPEDAIAQPPHAKKPKGLSTVWNSHLITAFGETKSALDWSRDERCSVTEGAVQRRIAIGWEPERAITAPNQLRESRRRSPGVAKLVEAFGEAKTIAQWAADERCVVSRAVLKSRLDRGVALEYALSIPGPTSGRRAA